MEEPRLDGAPTQRTGGEFDESRSSCKYVRNSKGDTQVEVKVYDGSTREEMSELQQIAFDTYKAAVEAAGLLVA